MHSYEYAKLPARERKAAKLLDEILDGRLGVWFGDHQGKTAIAFEHTKLGEEVRTTSGEFTPAMLEALIRDAERSGWTCHIVRDAQAGFCLAFMPISWGKEIITWTVYDPTWANASLNGNGTSSVKRTGRTS